MQVAILSHQAPPGDAIGNCVADKAAFFLDRGARVRVFVEQLRPIHPRLHALAHAVGTADRGDTLDFLTASDLVVVEYGQYYPALNLLPLLAGGKPRILFDYHGVTPPHLWSNHNREALLAGWQRRGIAWCADRVILHSRFAAEELQTACRFPAGRTSLVPHHAGGSLECRDHPELAAVKLRTELGLADGKIVLFVGRIAPNKRLDVLIRALAQLSDVASPVHLLVVGNTRDLYGNELERCLELARQLGVNDRIHVLGQVDDQRLRACYAAGDVFVMPSVHEGFCIPVVEAMAHGLPVIAAHAGALPETVGNAGILFSANDPAELAGRMSKVLQLSTPTATISPTKIADDLPRRLRVAVVSFRLGQDVVGGAERSLATMALALQDAGVSVELFATCTSRESAWQNDLPAGTTTEAGLLIHRFAVDPVDLARHNAIVRRVLEAEASLGEQEEQEFIRQSIHSGDLMTELRRRIGEFDAVLVGPYLAGLTFDVCRAFPGKTILAPCFHDEAIARLQVWQKDYRQVGGILYHSEVEKSFAEHALGLNHPRSIVLGAWLDPGCKGDAERGRALAGAQDYVMYCGRYSSEKNVPLLNEWMSEFQRRHPGRLKMIFAGQGQASIPAEPWCRNLGYLSDDAKADLLAGARCVINLSVNESLSLVALEAWANGTPVLAHAHCPVLVDLLASTGGGNAVASGDEFTRALVDLLDRPDHWREMGLRAQAFVADRFGSRRRYTESLLELVLSLAAPLDRIMRNRGRDRAQLFSHARWRVDFGRVVDETLDEPPTPVKEAWRITPNSPRAAAVASQEIAFLPLRIQNVGNLPALPDGPGAHVLVALTRDRMKPDGESLRMETQLPGVVAPQEEISAVLRAAVPERPGQFQVEIYCLKTVDAPTDVPPDAVVDLVVNGAETPLSGSCGPLLQAAGQAVAAADRRQALPDEYTDVTEGRLAGVKRRIKQKLLGNFKHAYVDVLSRQQTAFNRAILEAVQEALECCTLLDHAVSASASRGLQRLTEEWTRTIETAVSSGRTHEISDIIKDLVQEVARGRSRQNKLETRIESLENTLRRLESTLQPQGSSE